MTAVVVALEEASKVKQTNNKAKQHSIPEAVTFPNKKLAACTHTCVLVAVDARQKVCLLVFCCLAAMYC